MAKLLLAHPLFLAKNAAEADLSSPYFPLGLLYLAAYVRERGHEVAVFDGTFQPDESSFTQALDDHEPDIVGVSALLPTRETAIALAEMAADRGATVIVGGPDPTASPSSYLGSAAIDIVVHHEGEQTIARLLDLFDEAALNLTSLVDEPGVAFRRNGIATVNEPRPPIENLDELPLPARDLIDMDRYLQTWEDEHGYSSMTIATSRGCPFGCEWCGDAVHGEGFRQRSPSSVAAEVEALTGLYNVERLRLVDDVDGIDREWFDSWAVEAESRGAAVPFEPLNASERTDLPLLDVRDSL